MIKQNSDNDGNVKPIFKTRESLENQTQTHTG